MKSAFCLLAALAWSTAFSAPAPAAPPETENDIQLARYFEVQTAELANRCLVEISSLKDWNQLKDRYRAQLAEMLSLSPLPPKTEIHPTITGRVEAPDFTIEKLHFQSMPGLYVTGNLYLPKKTDKPLPAILYVCGHGRAAKDGISFGNKTVYQHHGVWFAQNGYACLIIDTIQLGEIEGLHHGTYRDGMWWWNSRGYTPAGVEAWNGIRAIDYLQSRPEIDPERIGVTGRSGGGAYSWWIAALDERIKAAVPVAGITDLQNHVVDGCVEGHCDCMFIVNTYRWDYPQVAALVAPRPLLIANSDKDSIFPLDGVVRVHAKVRRIYGLHQASQNLGLLITEGPHKDTQELQLPALRWFNRFLKGQESPVESAAKKFAEPDALKVFATLPQDERTSRIHESFVPLPSAPPVPTSTDSWTQLQQAWTNSLLEQVFAGWPASLAPANLKLQSSTEIDGWHLRRFQFDSQQHVRLSLFVIIPAKPAATEKIELEIIDELSWNSWSKLLDPPIDATANHSPELKALIAQLKEHGTTKVILAPRGIGPSAWSGTDKKQIQIRRRFMLLGQTLDAMRVWDIRRALQIVQRFEELPPRPLVIQSHRQMAVNSIYATLFEPGINRLQLSEVPASHQMGPDYLSVLRVLDIPQALALAAAKTPVTISNSPPALHEFAQALSQQLHWPADRLQVK